MSDAGLDRLIGRLIWVGVRGSEPRDGVLDAELELAASAHAGGVIIFDVDVPERNRLMEAEGLADAAARARAPRNVRSPEQVRRLTDHVRDRLGGDVVISVDQEGGRVSRLNAVRGFVELPGPREYAGLSEAERERAAVSLAGMCASAGCDLNLAPCVDVAINPDGPGHTALGRSFGAEPREVVRLAGEQVRALHGAGVGSTLKHFPGHGSARGDSHFGLVDTTETFEREAELAPYAELLSEGAGEERADVVMVSHLLHRGIDPELPCSLSERAIGGLLRGELGWEGLVMTDSLDMHAVADRYGAGEAAVLALRAGADVALEANNLTHVAECPAPRMHADIRAAVRRGDLTVDRLESAAARLDGFWSSVRGRRSGEGVRP